MTYLNFDPIDPQEFDAAKAGIVIRTVREKQGMTAQELSDEIAYHTGRTINAQTLHRIENGQEPKASLLFDICITLAPSSWMNMAFAYFAAGLDDWKPMVERAEWRGNPAEQVRSYRQVFDDVLGGYEPPSLSDAAGISKIQTLSDVVDVKALNEWFNEREGR